MLTIAVDTGVIDEDMNMKCTNCGNELKEGAKFCGKCGTAVANMVFPIEEEPGQKAIEEPIQEEPIAEPVEEPIQEDPVAEPVEEPIQEEPAAEPAEEPASEPAEEDYENDISVFRRGAAKVRDDAENVKIPVAKAPAAAVPAARVPRENVPAQPVRAEQGAWQQSQQPDPWRQQGQNEPEEEKEKSKLPYLIIGLAILAAVIGVLAPLLLHKGKGKDADAGKEEPAQEEQIETTQAAQTEEQTDDTNEVDTTLTDDTEQTGDTDETEPEETTNASDEDRFGPGIHEYEFNIVDCTWTEAYNISAAVGGHLVRFETEEEYYEVLRQIEARGYQDIKFWIGGCRKWRGPYYYWAPFPDPEAMPADDALDLNEGEYSSFWLEGEPSLYDPDTDSDEDKMNMFYMKSQNRWVWNDVPDDVLSVAGFYSGHMGFIIEYE